MDDSPEIDGPEGHDGDLVSLSLRLPQDRGFLRRSCVHCQREFKRLGEHVEASGDSAVFVCPYCYEGAPTAQWWTEEQVQYFNEVAYEQVIAPQLRELQRSLDGLETGGLLGLEFKMTGAERPAPIAPEEPADMTRVEFPCHPEEPLRIADDWEFHVACTICGTRYPVEDVGRSDASHE